MFAELYGTWADMRFQFYEDETPKRRPFLTIHAPDHIPGHEKYQKLGARQNVWYKIYFTRTVSQLLKAPYKTNCRDYDLGNPQVNQSQQECYQSCVLNWYRRECNCIPRVQFPISYLNVLKEDRLCIDGGPLPGKVRPKMSVASYRSHRILCGGEIYQQEISAGL